MIARIAWSCLIVLVVLVAMAELDDNNQRALEVAQKEIQ